MKKGEKLKGIYELIHNCFMFVKPYEHAPPQSSCMAHFTPSTFKCTELTPPQKPTNPHPPPQIFSHFSVFRKDLKRPFESEK